MKISRNFVMGLMATVVYFTVIVMIWSQLSELIKSFIGVEAWLGALIYACTLLLAVVMPISGLFMTVNIHKREGFSESLFMGIITLVVGFGAYPIVAHAFSTITESGLDIILFKESITRILDFTNTEPNLYVTWYGFGFFIYGLTAGISMVVGLAACIFVAVAWGWAKAIELFVDFPE